MADAGLPAPQAPQPPTQLQVPHAQPVPIQPI